MGKVQKVNIGTLKNLKATLAKKGGGGAGFITYVPKDSSKTVRFLQEPNEFQGYYEHWDSTIQRSYPCIGDECPGCAQDMRRSLTFLANAVDTESDKVIAFQVKQSVLNTLVIKYDKYGTLCDRDYEIARYGQGLDTTYDVTPEAPVPRKLNKYTLLDLDEVLEQAYEAAVGDAEDSTDGAKPKRGPKAASPGRRKKATPPPVDEEEEDDEEEEEEDTEEEAEAEEEIRFYTKAQLTKQSREDLLELAEYWEVNTKNRKTPGLITDILAAQTAWKEQEEEEEEDEEEEDIEDDTEEDEEEASDEEEEDDEEEFWTKEELEALPLGQLKAVAQDYQIAALKMKRAQIIDAILNA